MIAFRTWGKLLLAALLAGLLAGAGQLGLAYGLVLVRFARSFDGATRNEWAAQLSWVGWFAMVAAVAGALVGQRLARRAGLPSATGSRVCLAVAAGLGAAMVAPLCMQPARAAQVALVSPVTATGLTALFGAVLGIVAAVAALTWRPVAWNAVAVIGVVWFLALISVMPSLGPEDPLPAVRLGVLDPAWLSAGTAQRLAVLVMPAVALAAGAGAAGLARWRGQPTVVVATAGLAGPVLLAAAYLVAGPGTGDRYQTAPYWGSLVGVGAGALASVVAAVLRWPLIDPGGSGRDAAGPGTDVQATTDAEPGTATEPAIVPTDILRPIPGERLRGDGTHRPRHADLDDPAGTDESARQTSPAALPVTDAVRSGPGRRTGDGQSGVGHGTGSGQTGTSTGPTPESGTDRATTGPDRGAAQAAATALSDAASARLAWGDVAATDEPWAGADSRPGAAAKRPVTPGPSFHSQVIPAQQIPGRAFSAPDIPQPRTEDFWPANSAPGPRQSPSDLDVRTDDRWDAFTAANQPAPTEPAPAPRTKPAVSGSASRTTSTRAESPRSEPIGSKPAPGAEPTRSEPTRSEATRTKPARTATSRTKPGRNGTNRTRPDRTETSRPEPEPPAAPDAAAPGAADPSGPGRGDNADRPSSGTTDHTTSPAAESSDDADDGQPAGRGRRGLFRRNRASADPTVDPSADGTGPKPDPAGPTSAPPATGRNGRGRDRKGVPARDEEYVDWVSGLADDPVDERPVPDPGPRRSLRSSGRHHLG